MAMLPDFSIDGVGNQCWRINGRLHREGGPAIIASNGSQLWCIDGKAHRTDGPAFIYSSGTKYWYLNGKHYSTNKEYQEAAGLTDQDMIAMILVYGNVT